MAAGTINVYDSAKFYIGGGDLDLNSATLLVALASAGYTPALTHTSYATSVDAYELSGVSGYVAHTLSTVEWSDIGSNIIRFDAADTVFTASATQVAKYAVCYKSSDSKLLFYVDLDTAVTSGVKALTITLGWPANGIFRVS